MSDLTRCKPSVTKDMIRKYSMWEKTRPKGVSTPVANEHLKTQRSQSMPYDLSGITDPPAYGSSNTTLPAYSETTARTEKKNTTVTDSKSQPLDPELIVSATEDPVMKNKPGIKVWGVKRKPIYNGGMSDAHQSSWSRGYGQGKLW